jgi:hypothetical protein
MWQLSRQREFLAQCYFQRGPGKDIQNIGLDYRGARQIEQRPTPPGHVPWPARASPAAAPGASSRPRCWLTLRPGRALITTSPGGMTGAASHGPAEEPGQRAGAVPSVDFLWENSAPAVDNWLGVVDILWTGKKILNCCQKPLRGTRPMA